MAEKIVAAVGTVAEVEALDHRVIDSALAEVGESNGTALVGGRQVVLEMLHGEFIDGEKAFALRFPFALFGVHFPLLDLDVVFFREIAQGVAVGHLLEFHQETYGTASLSATETFADAF